MNKTGFTLIETILYIAVSAMLIVAVSTFLVFIQESKLKVTAINEVESQGSSIVQMINRDIRRADSISSPQSTGTTLSLLGITQRIYSFSQGALYLSIDGEVNNPLHNNRVIISNLVFQNLTSPNSPGLIRMQFDMEYNNIENRQESNYKRTFYGSAAIRQ